MNDEIVAACSLTCSRMQVPGGRCQRPAVGAEGLRSYCRYHQPAHLAHLAAARSRKPPMTKLQSEQKRIGTGDYAGFQRNYPGETRKRSKLGKRGQR